MVVLFGRSVQSVLFEMIQWCSCAFKNNSPRLGSVVSMFGTRKCKGTLLGRAGGGAFIYSLKIIQQRSRSFGKSGAREKKAIKVPQGITFKCTRRHSPKINTETFLFYYVDGELMPMTLKRPPVSSKDTCIYARKRVIFKRKNRLFQLHPRRYKMKTIHARKSGNFKVECVPTTHGLPFFCHYRTFGDKHTTFLCCLQPTRA